MDNPQIPAEWLPPIKEGAELLKLLKAESQLDWTFFSPAVNIGPGERTGSFRLGLDDVVLLLMARARSPMTITRSHWSMSSNRASTYASASPSATEARRFSCAELPESGPRKSPCLQVRLAELHRGSQRRVSLGQHSRHGHRKFFRGVTCAFFRGPDSLRCCCRRPRWPSNPASVCRMRAVLQQTTREQGGMCIPVKSRAGRKDGCFVLGAMRVGKLPATGLYWYMDRYPNRAAAEKEQDVRSTIVGAYGTIWMLSIADKSFLTAHGEHVGRVGPQNGDRIGPQRPRAGWPPDDSYGDGNRRTAFPRLDSRRLFASKRASGE